MKQKFSLEQSARKSKVEVLNELLGDEAKDVLYGRLMAVWRKHGDDEARQFCINDADKFTDDRIKLFLEKELFQAGEEGLDRKTPWNSFRRQQLGLPMLHSYEELEG